MGRLSRGGLDERSEGETLLRLDLATEVGGEEARVEMEGAVVPAFGGGWELHGGGGVGGGCFEFLIAHI